MLLWTKKQKVGKMFVTCGLLLLTLFSLGPVADLFVKSLESRYPTYQRAEKNSVKYVVMLGGGHKTQLGSTSGIDEPNQ